MFENIRDDWATHERRLRNGGFWVMAAYHFGRWAAGRRLAPWRWFLGKCYGVAKMVVESRTGVLIERETRIGSKLHIIHAQMINIHPDCVLGDRVGIMHGVTLGANMGDGVPTIGNDVFIGCNASVLGRLTVGDGARIAANSLVIADVPAGAVAMGVPARVIPNVAGLGAKPVAKPIAAPDLSNLKTEN
jgi:serine O-acetyltransferase